MTSAQVEAVPVTIDAEWQRIEVLARCLVASRAGREPGPDLLGELSQLQDAVRHLREAANPWAVLSEEPLPPLALDVLACVYASEAHPPVGWLFQELQSGGHVYATAALVHLLLAVDGDEVGTLRSLVGGPHGLLVRDRLVHSDGSGTAFAPLRPNMDVLARLLDLPPADVAPPGSVRVRDGARWDDLVLPPDREQMLREYLYWLRHRDTVVGRWGGTATGGPVALFSGASGTGKTFAASAIADALGGWPLYRVDLSQLVSKYIGETEKNIGRLLDAAHGRELVLQFDEVDSLMSKRGEIREARDRYANMEVSYLLARIEDHRGPCILTTNLRNQIDKAFNRRFQMVVEFPRPDRDARRRLWDRMLPAAAPKSDDLDTDFLAGAVNITGGNIRNAALHAAYMAAEDGGPISLGHVAVGVWRELSKERPQIARSDLGTLAEHLPPDFQEPFAG